MAKALLGHVGGADPRVLSELVTLRQRVRDLETQVMRLQAENDALSASAHQNELLTVPADQPVLA